MKKFTIISLFMLVLFLAAGYSQTIVFEEDFEGATLGVTSSGTPTWSINDTLANSGTKSYYAYVEDSLTTYLTTSSFSTIGNSFVLLEFAHICKVNFFDGALVQVSIDNGTTWTSLSDSEYLGNGQFGTLTPNRFVAASYPILWEATVPTAKPTNLWWVNEIFDISVLAANQANVQIRFQLYDGLNPVGDGGNFGWLLDDIMVTAATSELFPPSITMIQPIIQDTVLGTGPFYISADITDASGIASAYVVYTINQTTTDSIAMVNTLGDTYEATIPSMPLNTHVDYYVKATDNAPAANVANSSNYWFYTQKAPALITIGTDSEVPSNTLYSPLYRFSATATTNNTSSNIIYTQAELSAVGIFPGTTITSLSFDKAGSGGTVPTNNLTYSIYMANTLNVTPLATSTTWGDILSSHTLVYSNTDQQIPQTSGWVEFVLDNSFIYTGGSLEIASTGSFSGTSPFTSDKFDWKYTNGFSDHVIGQAATGAVTPTTTLNGTVAGYKHRPNIQIGIDATAYPNDAGVVQIPSPSGIVVSSTPQPVYAVIKNYGTNNLTSADVSFSVNDVFQQTVAWTGNLSEDMVSGQILLGNANFINGPNTLKAWSSNPNSTTDDNPNNDTIMVSLYGCDAILNGHYAVGGVGADFPTLDAALDAVENCGISGPVVFNIAPGTYEGRLELGDIPNASATNTITFKGTTGTILTYTPLASTERALIHLDGAKHLRFDSLAIIIPDSASWGWGIYMGHNTEDIEVTNCHIEVSSTATSTSYAGIIVSGSITGATTAGNNISDILIENNTIVGGYYGVTLIGASTGKLTGARVIDNNFINNYYYGVYLNNNAEPLVTNNTIDIKSTGTTTTFGAGIYCTNADGPFNISYNTITNPGQYGIYLLGSNAIPASPSLISNNAIGGGFRNTGTTSNGMYITSSANIDVFYNSINADGQTGRAINTLSSASGLNIKNNSFVFSGTGNGYAAYIAAASSVSEIDNNNYYSGNSSNFVYYDLNRADLAALQAVGIPANNDANSVSGDPLYLSNTNLFPMGLLLNDAGIPVSVTDDINGLPRDATNPDIGAYEYTPSDFDMGVVDIVAPVSNCGFNAAYTLSVDVKNFGLATATTFDMSYSINGGTPVVETFNGVLATDSIHTYTFTTTADLSANISYNILFSVDLNGDQLAINDTMSIFIGSKHDFYAGEYFMGFEDNEDYSNWTVLDVNNDGRTWEPGYNSTTFSNTGSNSARFFQGTTAIGDDWLISECFDLEAGKTYNIEFWYRAESATYPQNIRLLLGNDIVPAAFTDTLVSLVMFNNTTHQLASADVTVSNDGAYYFGWHATSPASAWYAYIDDINIKLVPPQEASVVDMPLPLDGCDLGIDTIAISIVNRGSDTINGNLTANYQIIGGATVVTETVTAAINPSDTLLFKFSNLADFTTTADSVFEIKAWIDLIGDPFAFNDTILATISSSITPDLPVGIPDTINYGAIAELIASSPNGVIVWYDSLVSQIPIHIGDTLHTNNLFATTTFYAEASNSTLVNIGLPAVSSSPSSGAGTTNVGQVFDVFAPTLLKSVTIYPVHASNASGTVTIEVIDGSGNVLHSATANVVGSPTSSPTPHVIDLDFNLQPGTNLKLRHERTGITGLLFEPSANAPGGNYGYPFEIPGIISINTSTLTTHPTNTARNDLYYYFYNWEVAAPGCFSGRIPVEAYVNLPQYEVGLQDIISPVNESCSDNTEFVSILISNSGTNDITSNLTATYIVNSGTPVVETVNMTVTAGDTVPFTFATPVNLNLTTGDTTLHIVAYINHPDDPYQLNDTLDATVTVGYTPPSPIAVNDTVPYGTSAIVGVSSPYTISWYASPTSDVVLDTGATYTTPVLYGNTAYYAAASESILTVESMGISDAISTTSFITTATGWGLFFSATEDIVIDYVHVYPTGTGTITIEILDSLNNSLIMSANPFALSGSGVSTKVQVPVNLTVPAGSYKMGMSYSGITNLVREISGANHPYISPSGIAMITAGASGSASPSTGTYYWFYDWGIRTAATGCESDRTEVWAVVTGNPPVDAGVVSIDAPLSPTNLQPQDVHVTIQNFGTDPLTSVTIEWTNNGVPQTSFAWTGSLPTNQTEAVNIGSFTPILGFNHLTAWTSNPNGVTDPMLLNDSSSTVIEAFEPLCGIYHIGGAGANFPNFAGALYALENYGVSCAVTFVVNPGLYDERIVIEEYTGVSDVNTVRFVGQSGAVINHGPTASNDRAVILLDGANYIYLDSLTIDIPSTASHGWGIHLTNDASNIEITNSSISNADNVTSTFFSGIVLSGSLTGATTGGNSHNVLIENNTINSGYYGISVAGLSANRLSGIEINNNVINNTYYYGIYMTQTAMPVIENNNIVMRSTGSTTNFGSAIYMINTDGPFVISKNIINDLGQYGIYISSGNSTTTPSLIANNMIGGSHRNQTSDQSSGLYITTSANIGIYYNSFYFDADRGAALYQTTTGTQLNIRNNSFAYFGGGTGYALRIESSSGLVQNNFNNYFSNGNSLVRYNGIDRADLAALIAVNAPVGNDTASQEGNPFYYSPTDLHAMTTQLFASGTPIAGITDDIDGDIRDLLTPCIGADEYIPANIDAAVIALVSPAGGCGLTANEQVSVEIMNTGLDPFTTLDVSYSINGGATVTETYTGNLGLGQSDIYTFVATADLSAPGLYHIFVSVNLVGDQIDFNDTLSTVIKTSHDFYASEYFMGFEDGEDYSNWTVLDINNDTRTWEPGYVSTTYANTGSRSARFFQGSTAVGDDWLITECFTLEGGKSYKIDFWYRTESASYPHDITLMLGTDIVPSAFTDTLVSLVSFNNTTHQLATAIVNIPTDGVYYFGWHATSPAANFWSYIDDINIRLLEPIDAGVTDVVNIGTQVNGGSSILPEVIVKNFGSDTLTTIPVSYSVNGGAVVTETWTGTLLPDSSVNYTFTTPFTALNGNFGFCAFTDLLGDGNNGNDTTCVVTFGIPLVSVPFTDDFEGPMNFYTIGAGNQWQHGVPAASVINTAHSPVNVWTTNLTGNYNNNSNYNLMSPRFNFVGVTNAVLGFWHWYDSELDNDGGRIQYSINNGQTWLILGTVGDTLATNWYNTSSINGAPAFTGSSAGWVYSTYNLQQFNNSPVPVQFRFNFFANQTNNNFNGWAIDDFEIFQSQIPLDAGVIAIVNPANQVITGSQQNVEVLIKNFGTDTLTTIPVRYRVNTGVPIQETWTGVLLPGDTLNYTFTIPVTQTSSYDLCAFTRVVGDVYVNNDTACAFIEIVPAQYDAGITEIITPGTQTIIGTPITVSVRIRNFGTAPLNSVDVEYDINSGVPTTSTYTGLINPGDEVVHTFTQTYVSPSGNYILCAETTLPSDQNNTNDKICKTVSGTVGIDGVEKPLLSLGQNMPNPASGNTVIAYNLPSSGMVTFEIVNLIGQKMLRFEQEDSAGTHYVEFDANTLPDGIYYYTLTFDGQRLTKKLVVNK